MDRTTGDLIDEFVNAAAKGESQWRRWTPSDALTVDDDARLWVRHARLYGDTIVTFDVHDPTGKHLARVLIPQRPGPTWLPIRARGNDVWIAVRDADDVLGIARYRLSNR